MNKITLDANLRIHLPDLSKPFTFVDEAGKVMGCYIPAPLTPPINREEIDRRKQEKQGKTYTTAEVLAHLEKL
jgi:hypothetical protein